MKKWICLLVASAAFFIAAAQAQTPPKLGAGEVFGNPTGSLAQGRSSTPASLGIAKTNFGGEPTFSVKSTDHSCAAALGDGASNDTSAIQCHIDYLNANFGGGIVWFPPGTYITASGGVIVSAGVRLVGASLASAALSTLTDSTVVTFAISAGTCPVGNHNGGLQQMGVYGYTVAPTNPAMKIGDSCNVTIRDAKVLYGNYGLTNNGVDSLVENSFVWGFTGALLSGGANWYVRVKFDQPAAVAATYGYFQTGSIAALTVTENHFVHCDFSGSYTDSVLINDLTSTKAVTTFEGSVFSSPIIITNAKATIFTGAEFGSTTLTTSSGFVNIVGSYAFSATTATGAATRSCAGNAQITC